MVWIYDNLLIIVSIFVERNFSDRKISLIRRAYASSDLIELRDGNLSVGNINILNFLPVRNGDESRQVAMRAIEILQEYRQQIDLWSGKNPNVYS